MGCKPELISWVVSVTWDMLLPMLMLILILMRRRQRHRLLPLPLPLPLPMVLLCQARGCLNPHVVLLGRLGEPAGQFGAGRRVDVAGMLTHRGGLSCWNELGVSGITGAFWRVGRVDRGIRSALLAAIGRPAGAGPVPLDAAKHGDSFR